MGVGLVRRGGTGSISHSKLVTPYTLLDVYGATYSIINNGHITLKDFGTVSTPPITGSLTLFAKDRAGKTLVSVVGPSGVDFNIQPALYGSTTIFWTPIATTSLPIFWGVSWLARNNLGVQSRPAKTSTNQMTSLNRHRYSTTAASLSSSGIQSFDSVAWRGSASGLGGFFFFSRFGMETIGTLANLRVIIGLSALNGLLNVEPSSIVDTVALVKDAADTTWQLVIRNALTSTKQSTGVTVVVNQVLDIYIHVKPNDTNATFELRAATGGLLFAQILSTGMVTSTTFLYIQAQVQTTTTTLSALAISQMYLEMDL